MLKNSSAISLLADEPLLNYHPGNSAVFNPEKEKGWDAYMKTTGWGNVSVQVSISPPIRFSEVKKVVVLERKKSCEGLTSMFGNQTELAQLKNQYQTPLQILSL